jgi:hypothetical protein
MNITFNRLAHDDDCCDYNGDKRENPQQISEVLEQRLIAPLVWQITAIILTLLTVFLKNYLILIGSTSLFLVFAICNIIFDYNTLVYDNFTKPNTEKIKNLSWWQRLSFTNLKYDLKDKIMERGKLGPHPVFTTSSLTSEINLNRINYDDSKLKVDIYFAIDNNNKMLNSILRLIYLLGVTYKNFTTLRYNKLKPDIEQNNELKLAFTGEHSHATMQPRIPTIIDANNQ